MVKSSDYEILHYATFSIPLQFLLQWVKIFTSKLCLNTLKPCHIPEICNLILWAMIMFMDVSLITSKEREFCISQCHRLFHRIIRMSLIQYQIRVIHDLMADLAF
jgi:hypothetical protein